VDVEPDGVTEVEMRFMNEIIHVHSWLDDEIKRCG
jgi:hypothetical protein